jgi:GNAT superfamily N-acetyltransferase
MNNETGYHIERLTKENLKDVTRLHLAVYGKTAPAGFFEKKYDTAYTGLQYIGFIAYNNGYYGVIPCFLQDRSNIILGAQSADTMTDPKHRYKGLFVELSNMTFDLARKEGIKLIFGFPNQNSLHGAINKLGWKMTDTMDCFIIPVKTIPLERIAARSNFLRSLFTKYVQRILKKHILPQNGISNTVITDGFSGVLRDAKYLSYKNYQDRFVIKIANSTVWIKIQNGLVIGDMHAEAAEFDQTMNGLQKIARAIGVNQLQFHASPGTGLHDLFSKTYNPVPSFPVLFQVFDQDIALNAFKFTFADIDIF